MPLHAPALNRRRFLAGASLTLGALALRGYPVLAAASAHFTHGVASGDPLADRVILWTRVLPWGWPVHDAGSKVGSRSG